ncbi:MAG: hypothetical protein K5989_11370 [Lachnospiraceae bacterium]|nr:hypothetical protein [Lachnospiraceae bacterium]
MFLALGRDAACFSQGVKALLKRDTKCPAFMIPEGKRIANDSFTGSGRGFLG